MELIGLGKMKDRGMARLFSAIVRELECDKSARVTRDGHLQIDIVNMPSWLHFAVVFHQPRQELGVELHAEGDRDTNLKILEYVKRHCPAEPDGMTQGIRFDSKWRSAEGWTRAYVRMPFEEASIPARSWAAEQMKAMRDVMSPVLEKAQDDGLI